MLKLILVDNEPWALAGLQTIIDWKSFGYEIVDCCTCGEDAMQAILDYCPDVVFTDVRMDDLSGVGLIVKTRESGLTTVFVIVSAYSDFEVARNAIKYGAYRYLLKPLNQGEVEAVAVEIFDKLTDNAFSQENKKNIRKELEDKCGFVCSENRTVADIQLFLANNFCKDIRVSDLAKKFFLSETYLCDLFKKHTDSTILSFIRRVRIHRACDLLGRDIALAQVAEAVGYQDYSYFGKLFRAEMGMTPETFKKQGRGSN